MSFRARLTSFFVVIVVVPMLAVGVLVYSLISDSERAKAEARANGLITAAASLYANSAAAARDDAQTFAHDPALLVGGALAARVSTIVSRAGLARVAVTIGSRTVADVGDKTALAPGVANVSLGGPGTIARVTVSELTAAQYARMLAAPDVAVVVQQDGRRLASTLRGMSTRNLPRQGRVRLGGVGYQTASLTVSAFDGSPVSVTVLSSLSATSGSVGTTRLVAAIFIVGFLLLAFAFSVLASRALQGQVSRFLHAARRLAGGDFSSPIPTDGHDEFAALGHEFNNMSDQLARRLDELSQQRARVRESIRRLGEALASNLDRPALLELALQTAVDAVQSGCGRVSARADPDGELVEAAVVGSLAPYGEGVSEAEQAALRTSELGEHATADGAVLSVPLGPLQSRGQPHGLLTVARRGPAFTDDERELLRSLAAQAALALENVDLHFQVRRQAVTDELTGLANHGRFRSSLAPRSSRCGATTIRLD